MTAALHTELESLGKAMSDSSLRQLFASGDRCDFYNQILDCQFDYSRQLMTKPILKKLIQLAEAKSVPQKIQDMFSFREVNFTEKRAVYHMATRSNPDMTGMYDADAMAKVHEVIDRIKVFSDRIRKGQHLGYTGHVLTDVVCVGIGGSHLGTEFVYEALRTHPRCREAANGRRLHFLANVDPDAVTRALQEFNPQTTLVLVMSKTFTTAETMLNARTVKKWLTDGLGTESAVAKHFAACSTNLVATTEFGIAPENVFGFWDWVGGRFSVTSAIGVLPLTIQFGWTAVEQFLSGARAMDVHFKNTPMEANLPVQMALVAYWNRKYLGHPAVAVLPYAESLHRFAAHIQQMNMESNGKAVKKDGTEVEGPTGPVIFGEPGTNSQHSFYQLLHQGQVVPAEFIGFVKSNNPTRLANEPVSNHDELMSNFFAQPDALAFGKTAEEVTKEGCPPELVNHKSFPGNRPSVQLLLPECSAYYVGMLLALYEHRTAVEGFLYEINSFDQYGVELGKVLAKDVRNYFTIARAGNDSEMAKKNLEKFNAPSQRMMKAYLSNGQS